MDNYPTWQNDALKPEAKIRVVAKDIVHEASTQPLTKSELEGIKKQTD